MFVKKGNEFLSGVSLKHLEGLYEKEAHPKAKIRLHCAILRKKGKSETFIAEVTGKPVTTISGILHRFEKKGVVACYAVKQKGQPPKLSSLQKKRLKKVFSQSPEKRGLPFIVWTTKLVQYFLHKIFHIDYAMRHVRRILSSLGFSLQKPRPEHVKANKALQAHFKKNFDADLERLSRVDMRSSFWMKAPSA